MDVETGLETLLVVAIVSPLAPFIVALFGRVRPPQVVVLIVGGVVVGPEVLDWADPASVGLLADVGLGFLFLMAGYELELGLFAEHVGRRAVVAWFVSAGLAIAVTGMLAYTSASSTLSCRWLWVSPRRRSEPCCRSCGTTTCSVDGSGPSSCPQERWVSSADRRDRHLPERERKFLGLASLVAMSWSRC